MFEPGPDSPKATPSPAPTPPQTRFALRPEPPQCVMRASRCANLGPRPLSPPTASQGSGRRTTVRDAWGT